MSGPRCSELSRAARERLPGTAATVDRWLLVELPGTWPRDVSAGDGLPEGARAAVRAWLAGAPRSRLLLVRRPGRSGRPLLVFVVRADQTTPEVRRIELASLGDLAGADFGSAGDVVETQLVLVCGHGSRDSCCALRGTAVFGALARRLGDEELWVSSHQGGHRFAANVLVLPAGLQFGRVEPEEAPDVVARALAGRIELGRYRGRTCYEPGVQAAEHAVRQASGLEGIDDVAFVGVDGSVVRLRARDGRDYTVSVDDVEGPAVPASCGAEPVSQRQLHARLT